MAGDHYFSPDPQSPLRTSVRTLTLRGNEVTLETASGTFSPGGLDAGTEVLLKYAPKTPSTGAFLDIGCGWGPLTVALALEAPDATVFGVDVNERALQVARDNAENLGLSNVSVAQPEGVPEALMFELIWSNPPIRVGKQALHEILSLWLPRLSPDGEAYLVVAKKLGADSLLEWLNSGAIPQIRAERVETSRGYRILRVARA
jgi:16S rRNA (guanine1207-N2)-methyltransferase